MPFQITPMALVVASLLFHQVNRHWEYGFSGVGHHFAPVFGIRLPRAAAALGQVAALPLALLVVLSAHSLPGRALAVVLAFYWMLATHRRLSDHSWLGFVAAAVMAFAPATVHPVLARDLLAGVYLTAALLKVNDEYLFTGRSAGRVVTAHYLRLLGLRVHPRLLNAVPVAVITVEFAAGALLCVPGGEQWSLWLAILMHLAFGVSGNLPFSVVAMALWVTALSPAGSIAISGGTSSVGFGALTAGLLCLATGRSATGRRPPNWLAKDFCQGVVFGALCALAVLSRAAGPEPVGSQAALVHVLVALAFVLNFLLVVTGVKLEWAFAMFTSLRPFGRSWLERHRFKDWPRYYTLTLPARIPKALLREIDPEFIYLATRAENVVHEGVVYHLEAAAQKCSVSFSPQAMAVDPFSRGLVPAPPDPRRPAPRPRLLAYPAIAPKSLDRRYLV
ncbi:hypothetical protein ABZ434_25920 [Streptomyces sp. NPDC005761]|uniref:hypothetical protein n=1 Tax=unclassified Streptomyces TaxID=2593676 RepID=UPI0033F44065